MFTIKEFSPKEIVSLFSIPGGVIKTVSTGTENDNAVTQNIRRSASSYTGKTGK